MSWAVAAAALCHSRAAMERCYRRSPTRDWFSTDAAEHRLRVTLAEGELHLRSVELEAWRDYHGATVRSASSLALALFAQEELGLDAVVQELGPDGPSPAWLVGPAFAGSVRAARRFGRKDSRNLHADDERERFLHGGCVFRRRSDPRGELGIRMSPHGLEVAFGSPAMSVRTDGDEAIVVVERPVPEAVRLAMVGRPVGTLIGHPVLRDPALVVIDVDGLTEARPLSPDAWTMVVRAPRVPWRLPWARGRA